MKIFTSILVSLSLLSTTHAVTLTLTDWVGLNQTDASNQGYWDISASDSTSSVRLVVGGLGAGFGSNSVYPTTSGTSYDGWGAVLDDGTANATAYNNKNYARASRHNATFFDNDGNYLRFGNGNQASVANFRKLDFMVINTGTEAAYFDGYSFSWNYSTNGNLSAQYLNLDTSTTSIASSNLLDVTTNVELDNGTGSGVRMYNADGIIHSTISTSTDGTLTPKNNYYLNPGDGAAFRIIGTQNGTHMLDNLTVTLTTVPEPSTYALLTGFAAFLFIVVRKRIL